MKYLVATFTIETTADLMQDCQDLLADGAAEVGFESFEETETGLKAYVQKELFDKELLDDRLSDFPIGDAEITYEVKDAEYKDWNQEWEEQGFEPIYVDNQVVIYDAKHPELSSKSIIEGFLGHVNFCDKNAIVHLLDDCVVVHQAE